MDDHLWAGFGDQSVYASRVADVEFRQTASWPAECVVQVGFLRGALVKWIEVVDDEDFIAFREQSVNQM
jgi:hypothetical protein